MGAWFIDLFLCSEEPEVLWVFFFVVASGSQEPGVLWVVFVVSGSHEPWVLWVFCLLPVFLQQ